MENHVTEITCQLIAYVGSAKSAFIEAMRAANRGDVAAAEEIFADGMKDYATAYESHKEFLEMFSNGEKVEVDILLVHAECSLMSTEDFKALAEEAIDLAKVRTNGQA